MLSRQTEAVIWGILFRFEFSRLVVAAVSRTCGNTSLRRQKRK